MEEIGVGFEQGEFGQKEMFEFYIYYVNIQKYVLLMKFLEI